MAENSAAQSQDMEAHNETYEGFVSFGIATVLACFFVLVCLVINAFSNSGALVNLPVSLIGMFAGFVFLAVEVKAKSSFLASTVLLILYAILAVFMVA
ncbi:MAG: aa3-type cytochrome c oxidase subunit IV [Hyphomicrobiales bacterium]